MACIPNPCVRSSCGQFKQTEDKKSNLISKANVTEWFTFNSVAAVLGQIMNKLFVTFFREDLK